MTWRHDGGSAIGCSLSGSIMLGTFLTLFCAYTVYYMGLMPCAKPAKQEASLEENPAVALVHPEEAIYRPHNRSNSVTVVQIPLNDSMLDRTSTGMAAYLVRDDRTGRKAVVLRDRVSNGSVSMTTVAEYEWLERQ